MSTIVASSIITRTPQGDADFWRMRQLLVDTVPTTPIGFNWDVRWLEGQRFYDAHVDAPQFAQRPIRLWENAAGELAAFVLPESSLGTAYLQVHPDYRYLEEELVAWAEAQLSARNEDTGRSYLEIPVYEYDALRQQTLARRGYEKTPYWGMTRHMRLGQQPRPTVHLAEGYTLRTTCPEELADCRQIADLLNAAFGRTFHNPWEYQNFTRRAPSFRNELDLVAVAPDGTFAAYVGIPYDEANRLGIFEPVCTHPDHLRRRLARTLMTEGLLRLWQIGAQEAIVGTGDMEAANGLYTSMGFTEAYKNWIWRKEW
ncbi:MAG: GNAT family N-acetyltransferase [Caldilineaceae bacterium]